MVWPTVQELLELPAFAGVEVVAGTGRLDQPVTWVHVAEVLDVGRFLAGGELVLSTGLQLARSSDEVQTTYLRSLVEAGAAGLLLELVQWLPEVPMALLQTARLLEFPLLVFRHEVRFADLTRAAHQRILHQNPISPNLLGWEAILDALLQTGRAGPFVRGQLGSLLDLPPKPRSTLVLTLEALLLAQFNMAQTARQLGVRRQSLYYRLEQLEARLGDLTSTERRLGLWVALELLKRGIS